MYGLFFFLLIANFMIIDYDEDISTREDETAAAALMMMVCTWSWGEMTSFKDMFAKKIPIDTRPRSM